MLRIESRCTKDCSPRGVHIRFRHAIESVCVCVCDCMPHMMKPVDSCFISISKFGNCKNAFAMITENLFYWYKRKNEAWPNTYDAGYIHRFQPEPTHKIKDILPNDHKNHSNQHKNSHKLCHEIGYRIACLTES